MARLLRSFVKVIFFIFTSRWSELVWVITYWTAFILLLIVGYRSMDPFFKWFNTLDTYVQIILMGTLFYNASRLLYENRRMTSFGRRTIKKLFPSFFTKKALSENENEEIE